MGADVEQLSGFYDWVDGGLHPSLKTVSNEYRYPLQDGVMLFRRQAEHLEPDALYALMIGTRTWPLSARGFGGLELQCPFF